MHQHSHRDVWRGRLGCLDEHQGDSLARAPARDDDRLLEGIQRELLRRYRHEQ